MNQLTIGQVVKVKIMNKTFTAKITRFGTHKGRDVVDLNNNRFAYYYQILN